METVNGVTDGEKGGPPPPSPLTGCYLLVVVGEPHTEQHKDIILQRIAKGLLSWDLNDCLVDLEKELAIITEQALEGEEARYGERLIQFASENLVTEILIHPVVSTLAQCMRNLLSSFTRHRHIIHAGYTFAANGSWALQDGTFSLADFSEAFQELEVQRVIRAYENGISLDLHCSPEGDWSRLPKEPFAKACKVRVNPTDVLTTGSPAIGEFINYISPFLVPTSLENLLESSDVVGNIRFSRPTLYVFPGGQGDAALFGINGFNMLLDGGFSRKACFWDFVRHLDRLDAVLMTRLNNSNVGGISSVLRRKKQDAVYPQIGHFFCNLQERKAILSPDGDKDKDPLLINLLDEGQEIISNLRHLNLQPQACYRDSEPINLYHKVGHGTLDMYVLSPAKDSKEVREFLQRWNQSDQKLFANSRSSREFSFPVQNLISIAALLVWQPANPSDTITRILYPGSSPQRKVFEGLDRLKNLEFIKHPVCTEKSLVPGSIVKKTTKDALIEKVAQKERISEKKENKIIENNIGVNGDIKAEVKEKLVKKSDSTESERSTRAKKIEDAKNIENEEKPKAKPKATKARSESQQRKKLTEKKTSPTTPKKTVENGDIRKPIKRSPLGTPAKSAKDASNRKVIESKTKTAKLPPAESKAKVERKPISRRPKGSMKAPPISPIKKLVNGVQKPDSISRKGKLDKEGTTDSSTVSTPSADQESVLKKDISKLTPEEIQQLKAQELADLKEEQEAVKEIEAVFRKGETQPKEDEDLRKVKDVSIEDKIEKEEYLIIEKEEIDHDSLEDKETKEDEIHKLARDSEESEKQRKLSTEEKIIEKQQEIQEQVDEIVTEAEAAVKAKEETAETGKEVITSPEEKLDLSSDKKTTDKEIEEVKDIIESHPDEKVSIIKSGDTTTAPTLPEDERIPLDEIKEDNGQIIEEKHVKEETKEKEVPVIQLPPKTFEPISKVPGVVGIRLDKQSHIRDIVKTPDEVADLPVHEEVDYEYTHELKADTRTNEIVEDKKDVKVDDKIQDFIKYSEEVVGLLKEKVKEIELEKDKDEVVQDQLKEIIEDVKKTSVMQEALKHLTDTVLENEVVLEIDILKDTETILEKEPLKSPVDVQQKEVSLDVEEEKLQKEPVERVAAEIKGEKHIEPSKDKLSSEDVLEKAEVETKEKVAEKEKPAEEKADVMKLDKEVEEVDRKDIVEGKEKTEDKLDTEGKIDEKIEPSKEKLEDSKSEKVIEEIHKDVVEEKETETEEVKHTEEAKELGKGVEKLETDIKEKEAVTVADKLEKEDSDKDLEKEKTETQEEKFTEKDEKKLPSKDILEKSEVEAKEKEPEKDEIAKGITKTKEVVEQMEPKEPAAEKIDKELKKEIQEIEVEPIKEEPAKPDKPVEPEHKELIEKEKTDEPKPEIAEKIEPVKEREEHVKEVEHKKVTEEKEKSDDLQEETPKTETDKEKEKPIKAEKEVEVEHKEPVEIAEKIEYAKEKELVKPEKEVEVEYKEIAVDKEKPDDLQKETLKTDIDKEKEEFVKTVKDVEVEHKKPVETAEKVESAKEKEEPVKLKKEVEHKKPAEEKEKTDDLQKDISKTDIVKEKEQFVKSEKEEVEHKKLVEEKEKTDDMQKEISETDIVKEKEEPIKPEKEVEAEHRKLVEEREKTDDLHKVSKTEIVEKVEPTKQKEESIKPEQEIEIKHKPVEEKERIDVQKEVLKVDITEKIESVEQKDEPIKPDKSIKEVDHAKPAEEKEIVDKIEPTQEPESIELSKEIEEADKESVKDILEKSDTEPKEKLIEKESIKTEEPAKDKEPSLAKIEPSLLVEKSDAETVIQKEEPKEKSIEKEIKDAEEKHEGEKEPSTKPTEAKEPIEDEKGEKEELKEQKILKGGPKEEKLEKTSVEEEGGTKLDDIGKPEKEDSKLITKTAAVEEKSDIKETTAKEKPEEKEAGRLETEKVEPAMEKISQKLEEPLLNGEIRQEDLEGEEKKDDEKEFKIEDKASKTDIPVSEVEISKRDAPLEPEKKEEIVDREKKAVERIEEDKIHLEKIEDKLQQLKEKSSEPKTEIIEPITLEEVGKTGEIIKATKEDKVHLEKLEEKLQQLKESTELKTEQTQEEKKDEAIEEQDKKSAEAIEKGELGRKSPKEREEDVIKIVTTVAEVLKSDAPLEEFEGKLPVSTYSPYTTSYTTELRETHITTVDSPITESKTIKTDDIPTIPEEPHAATASFLEEERKMAPMQEKTEDKRSSLLKESQELMMATSKIISDIKTGKVEDKDSAEEPTVHRMLVTASSEDGGEEIEICPEGTITFSKSSESSGRSSPEKSQELSKKSSIVDTISDSLSTVKQLRELLSEKDSGIDDVKSDTDLDIQEKFSPPPETDDDKELPKETKTYMEMEISEKSPDKDVSVKGPALGISISDTSDVEKLKDVTSPTEDLEKSTEISKKDLEPTEEKVVKETSKAESPVPKEDLKDDQVEVKEESKVPTEEKVVKGTSKAESPVPKEDQVEVKEESKVPTEEKVVKETSKAESPVPKEDLKDDQVEVKEESKVPTEEKVVKGTSKAESPVPKEDQVEVKEESKVPTEEKVVKETSKAESPVPKEDLKDDQVEVKEESKVPTEEKVVKGTSKAESPVPKEDLKDDQVEVKEESKVPTEERVAKETSKAESPVPKEDLKDDQVEVKEESNVPTEEKTVKETSKAESPVPKEDLKDDQVAAKEESKVEPVIEKKEVEETETIKKEVAKPEEPITKQSPEAKELVAKEIKTVEATPKETPKKEDLIPEDDKKIDIPKETPKPPEVEDIKKIEVTPKETEPEEPVPKCVKMEQRRDSLIERIEDTVKDSLEAVSDFTKSLFGKGEEIEKVTSDLEQKVHEIKEEGKEVSAEIVEKEGKTIEDIKAVEESVLERIEDKIKDAFESIAGIIHPHVDKGKDHVDEDFEKDVAEIEETFEIIEKPSEDETKADVLVKKETEAKSSKAKEDKKAEDVKEQKTPDEETKLDVEDKKEPEKVGSKSKEEDRKIDVAPEEKTIVDKLEDTSKVAAEYLIDKISDIDAKKVLKEISDSVIPVVEDIKGTVEEKLEKKVEDKQVTDKVEEISLLEKPSDDTASSKVSKVEAKEDKPDEKEIASTKKAIEEQHVSETIDKSEPIIKSEIFIPIEVAKDSILDKLEKTSKAVVDSVLDTTSEDSKIEIEDSKEDKKEDTKPIEKEKKRRESIVEQLEEGIRDTFSAISDFGKTLFDKGEKVIEDSTTKAEHVIEELKTTAESVIEKVDEDIKSSIASVKHFEESIWEGGDKEKSIVDAKGASDDIKEESKDDKVAGEDLVKKDSMSPDTKELKSKEPMVKTTPEGKVEETSKTKEDEIQETGKTQDISKPEIEESKECITDKKDVLHPGEKKVDQEQSKESQDSKSPEDLSKATSAVKDEKPEESDKAKESKLPLPKVTVKDLPKDVKDAGDIKKDGKDYISEHIEDEKHVEEVTKKDEIADLKTDIPVLDKEHKDVASIPDKPKDSKVLSQEEERDREIADKKADIQEIKPSVDLSEKDLPDLKPSEKDSKSSVSPDKSTIEDTTATGQKETKSDIEKSASDAKHEPPKDIKVEEEESDEMKEKSGGSIPEIKQDLSEIVSKTTDTKVLVDETEDSKPAAKIDTKDPEIAEEKDSGIFESITEVKADLAETIADKELEISDDTKTKTDRVGLAEKEQKDIVVDVKDARAIEGKEKSSGGAGSTGKTDIKDDQLPADEKVIDQIELKDTKLDIVSVPLEKSAHVITDAIITTTDVKSPLGKTEEIIETDRSPTKIVEDEKLIAKEEKILEKSAEDLQQTFEAVSDMTKSIVFDKMETSSPETTAKLLRKEEKILEKSAADITEAFEVVSDMSKSVVFEKCETHPEVTQTDEKSPKKSAEDLTFDKCGISTDLEEIDQNVLEKEQKQLEKSAEDLKDTFDRVSKMSTSLSFEKCEKPEDISLHKEEEVLEERAKGLTEAFETLTDMSKSVVFEKCDPTEQRRKSIEDEFVEKTAEDVKEAFELVSDMSKSIVFEKCDKEHKDKSDSEKETFDEKADMKLKAEEGVIKDIVDKVATDVDTKSIAAEVKSPKDLPVSVSPDIKVKDIDIKDVVEKVTADVDTKSIEAEIKKVPELLAKDDKHVVLEKGEKEQMEKVVELKADLDKAKKDLDVEDKDLKSISKETLPSLEEKIKDDVKTLGSKLEKEILDPKLEKTALDVSHTESKKLSVSDVEISLSDDKSSADTKSTDAEKLEFRKGDIREDKQKTDSKDIEEPCDKPKESHVPEKISVSVAGPSTTPEKSKDSEDAVEAAKQKELQDTLLHEKHIPGAVTPPTVPVSPSVADSYSEDIKLTTRTETLIKDMGLLRSSTPGSDDFEIITSTQSDISSGQVSKMPLDSEKLDSDEELSVTSQVAYSRDSSHYDLDEDSKISKIDPMSMSFYGALPDDDPEEVEKPAEPTYLYEITKAKYSSASSLDEADVKLDQINKNKQKDSGSASAIKDSSASKDEKDPIGDWGKPLGLPAPPTYLYEITKARFTGPGLYCASEENDSEKRTYLYEVTKARFTTSFSDEEDSDLDHINQNEQTRNMLTTSCYGDLPSAVEAEKDPIASWGKPLGLPSPAPPNDNKGTPKKERKLPPNVTAKNKLNDDKKRAESPSKYKNKKINPVYVDLTYVPHHGNSYYSYVDFFKRVRARYYVFSGIEPSREVYNALLEAKQAWEDKELEVTIIPTYDTDILGYWVAENEELLTKYKIDLSPSASRCTINLQDHETSCSAYRLEF